jgi:hypothetical protein
MVNVPRIGVCGAYILFSCPEKNIEENLKVIDPIHPPNVFDIRSIMEELRDGIHA